MQQVNNGEVVPKRLALSTRPPKPGDLAGIWEPVLVPLSAYAPLPASRLLYPRNAIAGTPPFSGLSNWLLIRINQMSLVQLRLEWWGGTVMVVVVPVVNLFGGVRVRSLGICKVGKVCCTAAGFAANCCCC